MQLQSDPLNQVSQIKCCFTEKVHNCDDFDWLLKSRDHGMTHSTGTFP